MTLDQAIKGARHLAQQTGRNQRVGFDTALDVSKGRGHGYYIGKSGTVAVVTPAGEVVSSNE